MRVASSQIETWLGLTSAKAAALSPNADEISTLRVAAAAEVRSPKADGMNAATDATQSIKHALIQDSDGNCSGKGAQLPVAMTSFVFN